MRRAKAVGERLRAKHGPPHFGLSDEQAAVLRNPTFAGAMAFWPWHAPGMRNGPRSPDVALAGVHKARLHWPGATEAMKQESKLWLIKRGLKIT